MRVALLLLVPAIAHAETKPTLDAWYPRVSAGAGIGYRVGDVALLTPTGPDLMLQAELKVRPLLFLDATFDYAPGTASNDFLAQDVDIESASAQLAVRDILMSFGDRPENFAGDMFVTGGFAREWLGWDGGGTARNLVMLGFGVTALLPHEHVDQHLRFGFRLLFGRAPDPGKRPAGCDGPCDMPTKTEPYDLSMVMEVSCHIGH
jgi:hypothetical protein